MEVNEVFDYCNETSLKAATRTDTKRKWLSGFDLCNLTSGANRYFQKDRRRYDSIDFMAKSVLDSGWGMFKGLVEYKSQQAARSFEVVSESNTSVAFPLAEARRVRGGSMG